MATRKQGRPTLKRSIEEALDSTNIFPMLVAKADEDGVTTIEDLSDMIWAMAKETIAPCYQALRNLLKNARNAGQLPKGSNLRAIADRKRGRPAAETSVAADWF